LEKLRSNFRIFKLTHVHVEPAALPARPSVQIRALDTCRASAIKLHRLAAEPTIIIYCQTSLVLLLHLLPNCFLREGSIYFNNKPPPKFGRAYKVYIPLPFAAFVHGLMAGGGIVSGGGAPLHVEAYHGKMTWYVVGVALIAASGGLLFGYDLGVTGGVESMVRMAPTVIADIRFSGRSLRWQPTQQQVLLIRLVHVGQLPTKVLPQCLRAYSFGRPKYRPLLVREDT